MTDISLKNLLQSTPQQVFDFVKPRLLAQGKKSEVAIGGELSCAYRDGALRCAFGFLIADDEYDSKWETYSADCVIGDFVTGKFIGASQEEIAAKSGVLLPDVRKMLSMCTDLQNVHDFCPVEDWPDRLDQLAAVYGLTP